MHAYICWNIAHLCKRVRSRRHLDQYTGGCSWCHCVWKCRKEMHTCKQQPDLWTSCIIRIFDWNFSCPTLTPGHLSIQGLVTEMWFHCYTCSLWQCNSSGFCNDSIFLQLCVCESMQHSRLPEQVGAIGLLGKKINGLWLWNFLQWLGTNMTQILA